MRLDERDASMVRLRVVDEIRRVLLFLRLNKDQLIQPVLRHPQTVQAAEPCEEELPALFHGNSLLNQEGIRDFPQVGLFISGGERLDGRYSLTVFILGAAIRCEELEIPACLIVHPKPDLLDPLSPDPQRERDQFLLEFPWLPLPQLHQPVELQGPLDL